MKWPAVLAALALAGCSRYWDAQPVESASATRGSYVWSTQPKPVLARGGPGEFDAVDALNPSVFLRDGRYWNLYSGFDGKAWHTGLAESADGLVWTRLGRVLSPDPATWEGDYIAANGSALVVGDEIFYWYQAGSPPRIGLARSRDGKTWRKETKPVLDFGPRGAWDERAAADPYVVKSGEWFYLYYLGEDRARRQRLGVARSRDGIVWTKLRTNPVLERGADGAFDENGLGEPAVWQGQGSYWMFYTGRARNEVRRLGLARSSDGVHWRKATPVVEGDQPWNSKVLCDATVLLQGPQVRVWYGGGDVAHPAENIHGQIGYGELRFGQ
jgi:predicted GH43/DUF377 family glycosyl hydrolase